MVDLVKDEIKPTNEIVEMIIKKHLEDQAISAYRNRAHRSSDPTST
jgi:hypothetical protein